MDSSQEAAADEVGRLRRSLNDLVCITALPTLWAGAEPTRVAGTLLDALGEMLGPGFVYARLDDPEGGPPAEIVRGGVPLPHGATARDAGAMLDRALGSRPWPASALAGGARVAVARLGVRGELGVVVAGSARPSFPEPGERLLLDIAANQATIGLQQARLLSERERVARTLDERVAERTDELVKAGERLRIEAAERAKAQAGLDHAENNLTRFLETFPGYVVTMSPAGRVEHLNQEVLSFFGKTREELSDWSMTDAVHPDDLPWVVEAVSHHLAAGTAYNVEHRCRRADGVYRWFQVRSHPVRGQDGAITGWYVLLTDIDDRKRAEHALRESEHSLKLIIDSMPALVWSALPDGRADFLSQAFLDFIGLSAEEAHGWGWADAIHPADRERQVATWTAILASGMPGELEARLRRADGEYRWLLYRGNPLRDHTGAIVKWYGVNTDIEDLKRAEAALAASERNLKLTIDTIPALAWTATTDGGGDFFNQHYLDFVGLSAEAARGLGWTARVHPDDLPGLIAAWQRIMASEAPGEAEARMCGPNGEFRWFLFRVNPLRDESGAIVRWYGVNTDIEARKRAEAELRRAYDSFADAQRLSKTGNFTSDIVLDEHTWSDELYRIFELEPGSALSFHTVRAMIHPDDLPGFDAEFERSLGGAEFDMVYRINTRSGKQKYLRTLAHLVERVTERPVFTGAIQDVTESRIAEEALDRARSELTHVARAATLSTLTASIAHEVNQPLAGIVTNASTCVRMLNVEPPNLDGARETVKRIIRDGHRASDVITRLRAMFTRKEAVLEPVDLNEATLEVLALSAGDLQRNRIVVRTQLEEDLPTVLGDRVQLQQVILNLLLNALDAMAEVKPHARHLLIETARDGEDQIRVSVRDSGAGVDSTILDKLFDAFYTTKRGGMGIGLSVSRSIVEKHHGRLWVEPDARPGSTFTFSLPCGRKAGEDTPA